MGWSGLLYKSALPVPCWGCVTETEAHRCIQEGNVGHPEELLSHRTVICFVKNRLIGRRRAGPGAAAPVPCPALHQQLWNFSGLGKLGLEGQLDKVLGNGGFRTQPGGL